ncbi:hypothetical protein HDU98_003231, partial [Podochytrium sp. JEL0797]
MASESLHIDTAKYIAALELAANTLKDQNSHLKERVESLLDENHSLKKQVPPSQPAK